jgi:hypothetical protein
MSDICHGNRKCRCKSCTKYSKSIHYSIQDRVTIAAQNEESKKTCIVVGCGVVGTETANVTDFEVTKILLQFIKYLHVAIKSESGV